MWTVGEILAAIVLVLWGVALAADMSAARKWRRLRAAPEKE